MTPTEVRPSKTCVLLAVSLLWGCAKTETGTFIDGGVDATMRPDISLSDTYQNPCAPGAPPALSGVVYAPNGKDPVAGAAVGIRRDLKAQPPALGCTSCAVRERYTTLTYADSAGRFHLEGVPSDGKPFKLSIQKGQFRRVLELSVDGCVSKELEAASTTLPGKSGHYGPDDTVPRIAVVSGAWDRLEKVLDKLGVREKTVYNGRDIGAGEESAQNLLSKIAVISQYHMVFINCGNRYERLVREPGQVRSTLRAYVEAGGRLFVTDYSYDFVEQTFPNFIDFEGLHDGQPQDRPEAPNGAEVGTQDLILEADVVDPDLKAWLALDEIGALLPNGKVQIVGFQTGWAVQKEVFGKVWVQGKATGVGVDPTVARPLTSSFDVQDSAGQQCGRVVFSSYHTHGEAPVLLPQERVLEYLILEIGGCPRVK